MSVAVAASEAESRAAVGEVARTRAPLLPGSSAGGLVSKQQRRARSASTPAPHTRQTQPHTSHIVAIHRQAKRDTAVRRVERWLCIGAAGSRCTSQAEADAGDTATDGAR
jgi:hypothetical protein